MRLALDSCILNSTFKNKKVAVKRNQTDLFNPLSTQPERPRLCHRYSQVHKKKQQKKPNRPSYATNHLLCSRNVSVRCWVLKSENILSVSRRSGGAAVIQRSVLGWRDGWGVSWMAGWIREERGGVCVCVCLCVWNEKWNQPDYVMWEKRRRRDEGDAGL